MSDVLLIGADDVRAASYRIVEAAHEMTRAADRMEAAFHQRRIWEEEYLARIEAIVREELDFYRVKSTQEEPQ